MKNAWKAETNKYRVNQAHKSTGRRCGKCFEKLEIEYEGDVAVSVKCEKCGELLTGDKGGR